MSTRSKWLSSLSVGDEVIFTNLINTEGGKAGADYQLGPAVSPFVISESVVKIADDKICTKYHSFDIDGQLTVTTPYYYGWIQEPTQELKQMAIQYEISARIAFVDWAKVSLDAINKIRQILADENANAVSEQLPDVKFRTASITAFPACESVRGFSRNSEYLAEYDQLFDRIFPRKDHVDVRCRIAPHHISLITNKKKGRKNHGKKEG